MVTKKSSDEFEKNRYHQLILPDNAHNVTDISTSPLYKADLEFLRWIYYGEKLLVTIGDKQARSKLMELIARVQSGEDLIIVCGHKHGEACVHDDLVFVLNKFCGGGK